jgi:hypothetical protein
MSVPVRADRLGSPGRNQASSLNTSATIRASRKNGRTKAVMKVTKAMKAGNRTNKAANDALPEGGKREALIWVSRLKRIR